MINLVFHVTDLSLELNGCTWEAHDNPESLGANEVLRCDECGEGFTCCRCRRRQVVEVKLKK